MGLRRSRGEADPSSGGPAPAEALLADGPKGKAGRRRPHPLRRRSGLWYYRPQHRLQLENLDLLVITPLAPKACLILPTFSFEYILARDAVYIGP